MRVAGFASLNAGRGKISRGAGSSFSQLVTSHFTFASTQQDTDGPCRFAVTEARS
jgi:hypothetical protein